MHVHDGLLPKHPYNNNKLQKYEVNYGKIRRKFAI